jgi:aspartyl-tRNA(Asn)/glutamyl-tRNA(Gln) amidotransferase subunit B
MLEDARASLPELPWVRADRLVATMGLPPYDAGVLTDDRDLAEYYEAVATPETAKLASNWIMTEVLRRVNEGGLTLREWAGRVPPARLRELLGRVAAGSLPGPLAKQALGWLAAEPGGLDEVLERHGARPRSAEEELRPLVREVLAENPGAVAQYRAGRTATLGFLVGQVMKKSVGQAVPQMVHRLLAEEIGRADAR